MDETIYIAYGSNLNIEQMKRRCPTANVIGVTQLKGYRLLFRGIRGNAVATIEKHKGGIVPVLFWQLQPADEAELDRYEGYPKYYRKEFINVQIEDKTVNAMVYIMNEGRSLGQPGSNYYDVILKGYKTAGFDPKVLIKAMSDSLVF